MSSYIGDLAGFTPVGPVHECCVLSPACSLHALPIFGRMVSELIVIAIVVEFNQY